MKKFTLFAVIALFAASFSFAAGAKEEGVKTSYVFAGNAEWPPLEFVDEAGNVVGLEVDMVKEIGKLKGLKVTYRNVAWDGIFAGLANGAYDAVASGVSVTEERKATMDFSTPFLSITQSIIVPSGKRKISDLKGMKGAVVGTQMGTTGDIYLKDMLEENPSLGYGVRGYDDIGLAIEDMVNGNLDCVVCDSVIASDFVLANENYKNKMAVTGNVSETGEPIAIAVRKGDTALLTLVNEAIAEMEKSGAIDALKKKWNIL